MQTIQPHPSLTAKYPQTQKDHLCAGCDVPCSDNYCARCHEEVQSLVYTRPSKFRLFIRGRRATVRDARAEALYGASIWTSFIILSGFAVRIAFIIWKGW